ncbi:hypothetical protein EPUS_00982 [Endocarpon pusillum Z07020]|uniref:Uncharacterized protein n=1 Tax=Endocarpon pusillum (strain Z07020 / HMAS-L-300199) TaxID=1263415 RepID=U1GN78_ENDPU|nr:uncharacterized protein EPUS_00982 [Endocarpon pusillum Z07020]ERF73728.1 hypothetical protein EPUS_00982 [Endocarpon pusillum Z07020]
MADQYLGKYNTILYFAIVYDFDLLILVTTALPAPITGGASLGGLNAAMIEIGLGTGGIKSNVSRLIAEQYTNTKQKIKVLKSREKAIVYPAITIQHIYMIFYLCINMGSLSSIATTETELHIHIWAAYPLSLWLFLVGFIVLLVGKKHYVQRPPRGSVILHAFKAIGLVSPTSLICTPPNRPSKTTMAAPPPSNGTNISSSRSNEPSLLAESSFSFPSIGSSTAECSAASSPSPANMQLHRIPNNIMQNVDPLTFIIPNPIVDRAVYPDLRKIGIPFKPITRIAFVFIFAALAMAYAAIVQHLIYTSPPYYTALLECTGSNDGAIHNQIHVTVQKPAYLLIGL